MCLLRGYMSFFHWSFFSVCPFPIRDAVFWCSIRAQLPEMVVDWAKHVLSTPTLSKNDAYPCHLLDPYPDMIAPILLDLFSETITLVIFSFHLTSLLTMSLFAYPTHIPFDSGRTDVFFFSCFFFTKAGSRNMSANSWNLLCSSLSGLLTLAMMPDSKSFCGQLV